MIPYGRQDISESDIEAVVEVLRSDWLTQGPTIARFERAVAEYCGAKHAVALANGTAALHIACLASGLGPGDRLWTSPNTFVASANCALYCGATVDFVDIDPVSYNISVTALERKLAHAKAAGALPKVVIPVHFAGQPCDLDRMGALAETYGFSVIEDASHAVGASFAGARIGACSHSEMVVFSFHPVKIITSGEGGMVLTNDDELYVKLQELRTHGITRDPTRMRNESHGPWYYEQTALGYNYRITDFQAALGLSQLERLDQFLLRRTELAARYDKLLKDLPVKTPGQGQQRSSAWHLYVVCLRLDQVKVTRRVVFEKLRAAGIGVNVHYIPVHTQPYYQELGFRLGDFPNAERYYEEAISLPLYPGLTDEAQDSVVRALANALA